MTFYLEFESKEKCEFFNSKLEVQHVLEEGTPEGELKREKFLCESVEELEKRVGFERTRDFLKDKKQMEKEGKLKEFYESVMGQSS